MLFETIGTYTRRHSGEERFFNKIGQSYRKGSKDFLFIQSAYYFAQKVFEKEIRESGGPYFEHLECTALIADYEQTRLNSHDPDVIVAALNHDVIEHSPYWTQALLAQRFNVRSAQMVQNVSKLPLSSFAYKRELRDAEIQSRLQNVNDRGTIIVKISDQSHNLDTLWAKPIGDQIKKIALAWSFYFPLSVKFDVLTFPLLEVMASASARVSMRAVFGKNAKLFFK